MLTPAEEGTMAVQNEMKAEGMSAMVVTAAGGMFIGYFDRIPQDVWRDGVRFYVTPEIIEAKDLQEWRFADEHDRQKIEQRIGIRELTADEIFSLLDTYLDPRASWIR